MYIWKCKGHILAQKNLDKNNIGGFLILDFKAYFIATLFKKVLYWHKNRHKDN